MIARAPGRAGMGARRRSWLWALVLGSCVVGCGGCSPTYVLRSAYEEARILLAREPIEELVAQEDLDPERRAKLELILDVRRFAEDEVGLRVGGAYGEFSEVPPGALLQVVSAAEQTRLQPYRWWFPIVGHVSYKGFFEKEEAEAEALRLGEEGYDTHVRGSAAFSTLGWFDDPVLSNWLAAPSERIADLVFHELLHRTTYVNGQTAFNESFANFVGHRAAIDFFRARADAEKTAAAEEAWTTALERAGRFEHNVARLRELYAEAKAESWERDRVLTERRVIFADMGPKPEQINNAVILASLAYRRHLDWFERLHQDAGGDLAATVERVRELSEDADDPFAALRTELGLPPGEGAE